MNKIRTAVIGIGNMGTAHATCLFEGRIDGMELAAVCDAFRVGMSMHSGAELGVSTAVNLHLAASTPQITYSIDGHYHHIVDDIIAGGKHQYENGKIKVPTGYGLGVELDEDKVAKYHALWKSGIQAAVNGSMPGGEKRHMSRSQY